MGCSFGSEKKPTTGGTITIYPYANLDPVTNGFYFAAGVQNQYDFNADALCALDAPPFRQLTFLDLIDVVGLESKVRANCEHKAWFEGCQCKLPPRDDGTDPPPPPPPEDEPPALDFPEYEEACLSNRGAPYWEVQFKTYYDADPPSSPQIGKRYFNQADYPNPVLIPTTTVGGQMEYRFVYDGGEISTIGLGSGFSIVDARIYACEGDGREREEPQPDPEEPIPIECPDCDCLNDEDKVEILSTLQLYISESNNRIRDELLTSIESSTTTILSDADTKSVYLAGLMSTLDDNARLYRDDIKLRLSEAKTDIITDLKEWIDGAKNQTIASIGASTAAILAGLAASTGTITAAITAGTATITGAITTATTTLTTALNAARDNIKDRIKEAEDKVIEDLTKEVKKGRYRYRVLIVDITSFPSGLSYTVGRNGAPDKYAFGWVQWRRVTSGSNVAFTERQFICNVKGVFVSPFPNEDVTAVVHLQPSVNGSSVLVWSNNEFTE